MVHSSFSISLRCFITLLNVFIPFCFTPDISFFCRVLDSTCPSSTSLNLPSLLLVLFSINTTNKYNLIQILYVARTHQYAVVPMLDPPKPIKKSTAFGGSNTHSHTRQFEESEQQSRDYINIKCFNKYLVVGMEKTYTH